MKYALAIAAAASFVAAEEMDDDWQPDAAGGECDSSADCSDMMLCVFSLTKGETDADDVWSPSFCGAEDDCEEPEGSAEDFHQFCMETMDDDKDEEDDTDGDEEDDDEVSPSTKKSPSAKKKKVVQKKKMAKSKSSPAKAKGKGNLKSLISEAIRNWYKMTAYYSTSRWIFPI